MPAVTILRVYMLFRVLLSLTLFFTLCSPLFVRAQAFVLVRPQRIEPFHGFKIESVTISPGAAGDLQPAMLPVIRDFVSFYNPLISSRDTPPLRLSMSLEEMQLIETREKTFFKGTLHLSISFTRLIDKDSVKLCTYRGTINYVRSNGEHRASEQVIENSFISSMQFLSSWFKKNKETTIKLARNVKCIVGQFRPRVANDDTIFYSSRAKLTWDDFRGKIPPSPYSAELFTALAYTVHSEVKNGTIVLSILIKASLDKDAMWVKPGENDDYSLNHEQRHFDLLQIAAHDFRSQLLKAKLSLLNYEGDLSVLYLDAWRHMTDIEEQYDRETKHGILTVEQTRWDRKIDQKVSTLKW